MIDSTDNRPRDALKHSIAGLRGFKAVGSALRPEMDPNDARDWLGHTLAPLADERREKLGIEQMVWIFLHAKAAGKHDGFHLFAELCGYRVTAVLSEAEQIADLARQAEAHAAAATSLSQEAIERMRHANPKIDAMVSP